jgi:hypothetical protein
VIEIDESMWFSPKLESQKIVPAPSVLLSVWQRYFHHELTGLQRRLLRYYTFLTGTWTLGKFLRTDKVLSSYTVYQLTSSDTILVRKPTVLKGYAVVQSLPMRSWQQKERMPHRLHLDSETFSATRQLTLGFLHLHLCMTF